MKYLTKKSIYQTNDTFCLIKELNYRITGKRLFQVRSQDPQ